MSEPLSDLDRKILEFLEKGDHCRYDFIDQGLLADFQQANRELGRMLGAGWITSSTNNEEGLIYRITELGQKCLQTGLQIEAERKFFWQRTN